MSHMVTQHVDVTDVFNLVMVFIAEAFARIPLLLLTTFLKSEVTIKGYQEVTMIDLGKTYRFT